MLYCKYLKCLWLDHLSPCHTFRLVQQIKILVGCWSNIHGLFLQVFKKTMRRSFLSFIERRYDIVLGHVCMLCQVLFIICFMCMLDHYQLGVCCIYFTSISCITCFFTPMIQSVSVSLCPWFWLILLFSVVHWYKFEPIIYLVLKILYNFLRNRYQNLVLIVESKVGHIYWVAQLASWNWLWNSLVN